MGARIGIVADTHGLIHPSLAEVFKGVDRIIHAGDIGGVEALKALERIAPVIAVRGNYDTEAELIGRLLPEFSWLEFEGHKVLLTHRLLSMDWHSTKGLVADMMARAYGHPRIVIFGHTHFAVAEEVSGIWFINPGYCGPDLREGPRTAAILAVGLEEIQCEIRRL